MKELNFDIEMHTHNDFGMATANALAGVVGGANLYRSYSKWIR